MFPPTTGVATVLDVVMLIRLLAPLILDLSVVMSIYGLSMNINELFFQIGIFIVDESS